MRAAALGAAALVLLASPAIAHPGSGIGVSAGVVYFVDTGSGVWKLAADGRLAKVPGPAFHWMAIDPGDRLARTALPAVSGGELARAGSHPTLILSSDFPVVAGPDGSLFLASPRRGDGVEIVRVPPSGASSVRAKLPAGWLNGLAAGPDGSLYATEDRAVRKIDPAGHVTTIVDRLDVAGCASIPGFSAGERPGLRGLDVDAAGNVYVAASGCGSLLEITPAGSVTTLRQLQAPWSPTGVVRAGGDLYVLEYLHDDTDDRRRWLPRVVKIGADGKATVVGTVDRPR